MAQASDYKAKASIDSGARQRKFKGKQESKPDTASQIVAISPVNALPTLEFGVFAIEPMGNSSGFGGQPRLSPCGSIIKLDDGNALGKMRVMRRLSLGFSVYRRRPRLA